MKITKHRFAELVKEEVERSNLFYEEEETEEEYQWAGLVDQFEEVFSERTLNESVEIEHGRLKQVIQEEINNIFLNENL